MKQILLEFKKFEPTILLLMKSGIRYSFYISIISTLILLTYDFVYTAPIIYYIGISLFRTSLFFIVGFIICGFAFNKIKRELKN